MADNADDLTRVLRIADERSSRSQLYRWMRRHHDDLARALVAVRPNWPALAAEFAALGVMDSTGKPASPERTRKTWWRVRTDVKRAQGRKLVGAEGAARMPSASVAPALVAPPKAVSSSQSSGSSAPPALAPTRKPFDPTQGADDLPSAFTFKPVRPR